MYILDEFRRTIIFPGKMTQGKPQSTDFNLSDKKLLVDVKTQNCNNIKLLFGQAFPEKNQFLDNKSSTYTILYFYGNAMCLSRATYQFECFRELGMNTAIPEYVGYGLSSGTASEEGCYDTAEAAYNFLVQDQEISSNKIIVAGWSLGSGVAMELATRHSVAGLILLSAFTSIVDLAATTLPLPRNFLESLIKEKFDNLSKIDKVKCPIFISHGEKDDVIPFPMSRKLYQRANKNSHSRITCLPLKKAKHNDFFYVGDEVLWQGISEFRDSLSLD